MESKVKVSQADFGEAAEDYRRAAAWHTSQGNFDTAQSYIQLYRMYASVPDSVDVEVNWE